MSRGERDALLARARDLLAAARSLDDPELLDELRAMFDGGAPADTGEDGGGGESWHGMIGSCPALLAMRADLEKFARTAMPVLIYGESGTGKELVAKALHRLSPRRRGPYLSENCAAIPETLLESVLFGHVRGAFTGAVKDHPGHFVATDRGTLFLDEIGDMPLAMQVKLLRVLQEGEVRPVGGSRVRKVDVRVIAATHRDLEAMVAKGSFREDLFYRLNVLHLRLPPLRERGSDILLMARAFLARAAASRPGPALRLSAAAEAVLAAAAWPGNVRQLMNEMQRVAALAEGPEVGPGDLSPGL